VEKIIQFLKQYGILVGMGIVGILILIYGVYGEVSAEKPVVEIVRGEGKSEKGELVEIMVDVAGAVEKPGLYKLTSGSRTPPPPAPPRPRAPAPPRAPPPNSLTAPPLPPAAGKVYIPVKQEITPLNQKTIKPLESQGKVNINTASMSELDGLTGIGEARARLIMDNRPYGNIDELVSKAKIPQSVYEAIKDSVSIY